MFLVIVFTVLNGFVAANQERKKLPRSRFWSPVTVTLVSIGALYKRNLTHPNPKLCSDMKHSTSREAIRNILLVIAKRRTLPGLE